MSLPKKVFKVFVELEGMYRNMVEQLVMYAVRNGIKSFTRLKALKYREVRAHIHIYPHTMSTQHAKTLPPGPRASYG